MKFIALSLIALLLAGCAASLPAIDPAALPAAPQSFKEGDGRWTLAAPPAEAQPRGEWWRSFSDPVLDELVERANRDNNSIQVAAAIEAARLRLRPILMTSIAFVMGVLPLAYAVGAGAEMRRAMGIAVFAGMIGVTAFGIFLTPVFYVLLRAASGNRALKHHGEAPREANAFAPGD